eukprot:gene7393-biopygen12050
MPAGTRPYAPGPGVQAKHCLPHGCRREPAAMRLARDHKPSTSGPMDAGGAPPPWDDVRGLGGVSPSHTLVKEQHHTIAGAMMWWRELHEHMLTKGNRFLVTNGGGYSCLFPLRAAIRTVARAHPGANTNAMAAAQPPCQRGACGPAHAVQRRLARHSSKFGRQLCATIVQPGRPVKSLSDMQGVSHVSRSASPTGPAPPSTTTHLNLGETG